MFNISEVTKILLEEKEMPKAWYNIQADMPNVPPAIGLSLRQIRKKSNFSA